MQTPSALLHGDQILLKRRPQGQLSLRIVCRQTLDSPSGAFFLACRLNVVSTPGAAGRARSLHRRRSVKNHSTTAGM